MTKKDIKYWGWFILWMVTLPLAVIFTFFSDVNEKIYNKL